MSGIGALTTDSTPNGNGEWHVLRDEHDVNQHQWWWPRVHIEIDVLWDGEDTIRLIWGYCWLVERRRIGLFVDVQLWDVCYRFPSYLWWLCILIPLFFLCISCTCFWKVLLRMILLMSMTALPHLLALDSRIPVLRMPVLSSGNVLCCYGRRVCWSRRVRASLSF